MRRALFLAVAVLAAAPAAGSAATRPALRIADNAPLTLVGTAFRAGETVTVRVGLGAKISTKRVEASATGRFVARFPRIALTNACSQRPWITAVGETGTRAWLKFPATQCPPPAD